MVDPPARGGTERDGLSRSLITGRLGTCASAGSAASVGARGSRRWPARCFAALRPVHRLQQEMVEGERLVMPRAGAPGLRIDQLELVSPAKRSGAPALGLTQIQSRPSGGRRVPLVSIAIVKPRSESSRTRAASICSSGSPPVQTTNGSLLVNAAIARR